MSGDKAGDKAGGAAGSEAKDKTAGHDLGHAGLRGNRALLILDTGAACRAGSGVRLPGVPGRCRSDLFGRHVARDIAHLLGDVVVP